MSYHVANLCTARKFGGPVRKQIIMFLADKASADGSGIWCSKATIQRHTELGASTIKRTLAAFLKEGILVKTGRRSSSSGYTSIYRIDLSAISALEPTEELSDGRIGKTQLAAGGGQSEPEKRTALDSDAGPQWAPNHPRSIHKPPSRAIAPETVDDPEFEEVWRRYPEDRQRGKAFCQLAFRRAIEAGGSVSQIADAVRRYTQESAGYSRSKVSFSDNWFRQERWRAHVEERHTLNAAAAESLARQVEQLAGWIKGRNYVCRHITKEQARAVLASGLVSKAEIESAGVKL